MIVQNRLSIRKTGELPAKACAKSFGSGISESKRHRAQISVKLLTGSRMSAWKSWSDFAHALIYQQGLLILPRNSYGKLSAALSDYPNSGGLGDESPNVAAVPENEKTLDLPAGRWQSVFKSFVRGTRRTSFIRYSKVFHRHPFNLRYI